MTVSHSFRESKLLEGVAGLFLLHGDVVGTTLNWVVLLSLLVEGDFTDDSGSELREDLRDAISNIGSASVGELLNFFMDVAGSFHLGIGELFDTLGITGMAWVDKSLLLHFNHEDSVL